VFLDRDGVVVNEVGLVSNPGQLQVPDAVPNALSKLRDPFLLIMVTNQSGIGRGYYTEEDLLEIHTSLVTFLGERGAAVDCIYFCPHHPTMAVPEYRQVCECRKPRPGMLLRAASTWNIDLAASFMVGDAVTDMKAARAAGVKGIKVGQDLGENPGLEPVVQSLEEAAELILGRLSGQNNAAREGTQ
jgi:D-glycero-D-manno-heptose 1,7-bisphosphate phosphatase